MRPQIFRITSPHQVCKLKKSVYVLRQAPRCWFSKLTAALHQCGFVQSYADYSLFTYAANDVFLYVLIYVNNLLITSTSLFSIDKFKAYMSSCFHIKDLGSLKYFLGIEFAHNSSGIYLC